LFLGWGCSSHDWRTTRCQRYSPGPSVAVVSTSLLPTPKEVAHVQRNKKPGDPSGSPGVQCVLCCPDPHPKVVVRGEGSGRPRASLTASSCRSSCVLPQESHRAVAAHSSSHVQSQSVTDHLRFRRAKSTDEGSWPRPAVAGVFEGDCRTRLWERLSPPPGRRPMSFYCPPPGSTSRQRLAGNEPVRSGFHLPDGCQRYRDVRPGESTEKLGVSSPALRDRASVGVGTVGRERWPDLMAGRTEPGRGRAPGGRGGPAQRASTSPPAGGPRTGPRTAWLRVGQQTRTFPRWAGRRKTVDRVDAER
jgi:hypothetical protein